MRRPWIVSLIWVLLFGAPGPLRAQVEFPREITVIVGFAPGGGEEGGAGARSAVSRFQPQPGYDQTARLYARHLGGHLPGSPRVLLRHLPGAGSIKAASFIANEAPRDGSALGVLSSGALLAPLFANPMADFGLRHFAFLGARSADEYVCAADGEAGVETLEQLGKPGLAAGSSAPGRRPYAHAQLLNDLAQLQLRIVSGYRDSNEMLLALRRGEVAVLCGLSFEVWRAGLSTWISNGRLKPLLRLSPPFLQRLTAVPQMQAIARVRGRADLVPALDAMALEGVLAWTLAAPASVSPDTLSALRVGFAAMQADRDYLREAARRNLEIAPVAPSRLEEAARALDAAPPAVLDIVKKLNAGP